MLLTSGTSSVCVCVCVCVCGVEGQSRVGFVALLQLLLLSIVETKR